MRILHFIEANGTCAEFRTKQPMQWLKYDGHTSIIVAPTTAKMSDLTMEQIKAIMPQYAIAFFNRFYDWRPLIDYANKHNIVTIYGTDDYYDFGDKNPFGIVARREKYNERSIYAAENCDGVIVSTNALKDVYLKHNLNTYFIPNMIDYSQSQWNIRNPRHKNVVIGYYGSPTHYHDLLEAILAIQKLMYEYPNLEFHYGVLPESGLVYNPKTKIYKREIRSDSPESIKYLALSKDMPQDRVKILTFKSIYSYGATYANFDIAIAPLADTPMNHYKSPLKILEPAAYNLPVVASPRQPFKEVIQHRMNGYIASDTDEWYYYLKRLVDSEDLRNKIGGALGYQVRLRYNISRRYMEWYYVMQTIARRSGKPFQDITKKPMSQLHRWIDRKWGKRD